MKLKTGNRVRGEPANLVSTGIEAWSQLILKTINLPWSKVNKGKLGLIEVAFARNAIVHASYKYTVADITRCKSAGVHPAWVAGDLIPLELSDTLEYRHRLECFMIVVCQKLDKESKAHAAL